MADLLDTRKAQSRLVELGMGDRIPFIAANEVLVRKVVAHVSSRGGDALLAADAIMLTPRPEWLRALIGSEMLQALPTEEEVLG